MPGSIQVSVFGPIDLSSPTPFSSLSLTVAMGKRKHQTVGVGELSIPVVSLRENLIVMVHNAVGEEILRTEFRTMLLLERGLWDNLFPLKNGGSLHMRLQFLLSEEDRQRIREMRDSAIKKRHEEKPGTRHRRSFSDNRIGYSPARASAEIVTEGMLLDHSEPAYPIVEPYFGQRGKFPASRIGMVVLPRTSVIGEGDASNLNFPQRMPKSFSVGMLSEISSHGKSKLVKESSLLKKETQNAIPALHYETLGNNDLKCDEIHMLDIGTEEIRVTKNISLDADPPYSAKFGSYITIDDGHNTIGSRKAASLAAGTSSERDFTSVNLDKHPSIIRIITNFETVREKENQNFIQRGGAGLSSNAAYGTLKQIPLLQSSVELRTASAQHSRAGNRHNSRDMARHGNATSTKGVGRKINIVDADKNNNAERNLRDKTLPSKKILDDLRKIEHPCQQRSLGEVARTVSDKNMRQSPSNEQTSSAEHSISGKKHKSRNWSGCGEATSCEGVNRKTETVDGNENGDEDQNFGDNSLPLKKMVDEPVKIKHPYHQGTSVEVTKTVNDENILKNPSNEQVSLGSLYEKAQALKSDYNSVCPIRILSTWTPRHLCITTGSKLLREFAESCTVSLETNPIECSSMREVDTKEEPGECFSDC